MSRKFTEDQIQARLESPDNLCNLFDSFLTERTAPTTTEVPNGLTPIPGCEPKEDVEESDDELDNNQGLSGPADVVSVSLPASCPAKGHPPSVVIPEVVEKPMYGPPKGKSTKPNGDRTMLDRALIVAASAAGASDREVAEAFDVDVKTVHNNKNGIVTPANGVDHELQKVVESTKQKVNRRVLDKLLMVEEAILPEDIKAASLKLKGDLLKALATVADKTKDRDQADQSRVVIIVPDTRDVSYYPTKDAPITRTEQ